MKLQALDFIVLAVYAIGIIGVALWVSRPTKGHERNTQDYFLAGKSLPWWAIGASLIAANISAEQIIGMSGSGYVMGLAIASYEWMAAITLLIVGKYFLPIFLDRGIYTMPQFLESRYDHRVRMLLAIFWLGVYIFVNLTSILWLGALAINTVAGVSPFNGMLILGGIAVAYSLYGGLKAVALTDIIQVIMLVAGGLIIAYLCMDRISNGNGFLEGLQIVSRELPEKFDMILSRDNPSYQAMPGISVILGGMWVMNLSYWGFNQYIIQRALAAKSPQEAQKGIVMAAYLKLVTPVLVVLPGIAAVMLVPDLSSPDSAYPQMMTLLPAGLLGLVFAALVAAIVSSVGSMMNSISTIFTLDIYANLRPEKAEDQQHLVSIGRATSFTALLIALICAKPLLGNFDQAFQYIQEFTGFFTPGIVVIFVLGMFWKRATANSALVAAAGSAALSLLLKLIWPQVPFMDRVGIVFVICIALAVIVSLLEDKNQSGAIKLEGVDFSTTSGFNYASLGLALILTALYVTWW
ncbi:MAG: SSS family solute:Na+ symporter [Halieaceae bacterium]|jgi:SSS family solute:Na+ symporter